MPDVTITALSAGRFELSTAASSTQHLRTVATFERQVDGKWQRIDDDLDVGFGAQGTAHRINVALHFDPSRPQMLAAAKRALPDDPELAKLR